MSIEPVEAPMTARADPMARLEALYRAEHQHAVHLALLLTGNHAVAQELAQEAFVRLHPHLERTERPGAYLRTTVVNLCRGDGRRKATADRHLQAVTIPTAPPPDLPASLSPVWLALNDLPDRQRQALVLRFYLDLPDDEIAELLGARPGTVRSLVSRGLAALQEVLAP